MYNVFTVFTCIMYLLVNIKLLYHMYRATGVHRITINTPDDTEVS